MVRALWFGGNTVAATYQIRAGKTAPCELWSIVQTNFGGVAENFVCEGTHTYCSYVRGKLEKLADAMLEDRK